MKWTFKWIRDWDYILSDEFAKWWDGFYDSSSNKNFFFSRILCLTWMKERKVQPLFCVAKSGELTIFYPLVILKMGILKWMGPAGKDEFDYLDPLFYGDCDRHIIESFWSELKQEILKLQKYWDICKFRGIRNGYLNGYFEWAIEDECPGIKLDGNSCIDDFMLTRHSSLRGDIYRQIRRLNALSKLELFTYKKDDPRLDTAICELLSLREKKWQYTKIHRSLFESVIKNSVKCNLGHFSELRLGGIAVSWHFGFVNVNVFYYYMPAINPDFLTYSPGKIHLYYLLDYALKNGMSYFDLMRGSDEYKQQWSNTQNKTYYYYTASPILKTKLKFLGSNLKAKVFHLIRHLKLKNIRSILLKTPNYLSLI